DYGPSRDTKPSFMRRQTRSRRIEIAHDLEVEEFFGILGFFSYPTQNMATGSTHCRRTGNTDPRIKSSFDGDPTSDVTILRKIPRAEELAAFGIIGKEVDATSKR